jgi:hypothetical protein
LRVDLEERPEVGLFSLHELVPPVPHGLLAVVDHVVRVPDDLGPALASRVGPQECVCDLFERWVGGGCEDLERLSHGGTVAWSAMMNLLNAST